ncbi:HRDC domain-containing protein [Suttonella sp. R2A3]|uniref:ribonuclease D n=1 Tax=Suttonella sp. R2A3 TaxID=2908648 RepID=UPI001F178E13|nr:HRDC domain-containing protein [Suttonella sp. R2A3]UJF23700.1 HRDC domain-containing protein [Suttonella sp. R2A3]
MHTAWRWSENKDAFADRRTLFYDSEFVRERSYYPQLALVQWQVSGQTTAVLCDPLEQTPPWQALNQHNAPIVMHSGSQDLELIRQESGTLPQQIRDTQIGFALCHPNLSVSFAELVKHYLDIDVDKSATRSDWIKRPLNNKQLDYAANDVGLLARVYPLLCAELNQLGRLSWWAEECAALKRAAVQHQLSQPWYKLRRAPQLKGRETAVAALLHQIREDLAREHDQPRRRILDDGIIVDIAKSAPQHIEDLAEHLKPKHLLFTRQNELIAGLANIDQQPYPIIPRSPRLNAQQRQRYNELVDRCQTLADKLNIHPDLLTTQKNLRAFCAGQPNNCRIDQGWRKVLFVD